MLRIALTIGLLASTEASAHCYSRWDYPWPQQRCGVARQMVRRPVLHSVAASSVPNQERSKNKAATPVTPVTPVTRAIALPSLAQADLDGGEADEPARARLLLRAALEAANGH
jgi:hypothetical protein